jgi:orotate phosphoribosyltransferase
VCHDCGHFAGQRIDAEAGPTTGGIVLAYEVARQMGLRAVFAEADGEVLSFRRGFVPKPAIKSWWWMTC